MTPDPITATPDTSVKEALDLLRSHPFRHLPIVDEEGRLVGITTEKSLVYASPASDVSLSVFEVNYLLSRMKVEQVMARDVITVHPDLPLEEAARLMIDHQIGCLPVVERGRLVGIISDTDLFRVFVEGLGGGHPALRITISVPEQVGVLARIAGRIAAMGGNIYSLGTFWGERPEDRILALRVEGVDRETLLAALKEEGVQIRHVWEPPKGSSAEEE